MKEIEYIIKFGLLFLVPLLLVFQVGPHFINIQAEEETRLVEYENIEEIKVDSTIPKEYRNYDYIDYIEVNVLFENDKTKRWIFRIVDKEHLKFVDFLRHEKLITEQPIIKQIPLCIPAEKLSHIKVRMGKSKLILNDQYVIGKPISIFLIILSVLFGIATILSGGLIFLSGIKLLVTNIKIYKNTGEAPALWNRFDNSYEAWKYILGGFKTKKKNNKKP
ncbi:hypothetical protein ATO12_10785 [Aquimarina atlantica]|uniref:Uncharacterized protein n=1 Tax=Aquimarina atlantica TaxID=1317122 RepID=A0A023BMZ4_9FLAO|nr:hypothetical protein [Aquimarina atlantica]EZH71329.1 hypothetical protein ATO12_10785 [Aquimarina atlantica]